MKSGQERKHGITQVLQTLPQSFDCSSPAGTSPVHSGEMQPSKHRWRSTVAAVIALPNDLDPYGLEPGTAEGAPDDEYESEAYPVASLLLNSGSVSRDQVDTIWQEWFQEPLSGAIGAAQAERFCVSLNSLNDSALRSGCSEADPLRSLVAMARNGWCVVSVSP